VREKRKGGRDTSRNRGWQGEKFKEDGDLIEITYGSLAG
jgi:hypothetical protein